MTTLQIYDPFAATGFDELFRGIFRPVRSDKSTPVAARVDVTETDKGYTVHAEIPGVNKEDIDVAIEGNQVTISAEVKRDSEQKDGERVLRTERYFGAFIAASRCPSSSTKPQAKPSTKTAFSSSSWRRSRRLRGAS